MWLTYYQLRLDRMPVGTPVLTSIRRCRSVSDFLSFGFWLVRHCTCICCVGLPFQMGGLLQFLDLADMDPSPLQPSDCLVVQHVYRRVPALSWSKNRHLKPRDRYHQQLRNTRTFPSRLLFLVKNPCPRRSRSPSDLLIWRHFWARAARLESALKGKARSIFIIEHTAIVIKILLRLVPEGGERFGQKLGESQAMGACIQLPAMHVTINHHRRLRHMCAS